MGSTGPSVVRLRAANDVPAAVRSLVALRAGVDGPEGIDIFGCDRSNGPGPGLRCRWPEGSGVKQLHET